MTSRSRAFKAKYRFTAKRTPDAFADTKHQKLFFMPRLSARLLLSYKPGAFSALNKSLLAKSKYYKYRCNSEQRAHTAQQSGI